ncbi:MAG: Holliday junction branch migration protein RuvA [Phycisphaerae bacterium]
MIVRLTGNLIDVADDSVVMERDGVAREVLVPRFSVAELAACRGMEVTLHTVEFLEGNQASGNLVPRLVGFAHPEDKLFFLRFVEVRGIGARKALKALTEPVRRIASWIETSDAKGLAQLPGIGARAAELIIASLKGKLTDLALPGAVDAPTPTASLTDAQRDAVEVLVAWGDARADAHRWLERAAQLHPDIDAPDEWVRASYRVKTGVEG